MNAELVFEGVRRGFGSKRVLCGVDLRVAAGKVTAILGRNGAGKSTLLKLALGLLRPEAGRIRVAGEDPARSASRVRRIAGYVPDRPDVPDWMTPAELLGFLARHHRGFDGDAATALLDRFAVPRTTRFKKLSRGEGMKAMLVAALAPDPRVLILDEPFGGLDPVMRDEVVVGVISALGERGRTVLVCTHDLDVVARLADDVAILADGRIVFHGPEEEFAGRAGRPAVDALREALATTGGVPS